MSARAGRTKVHRLPREQREFVNALIREGTHTLREMVELIAQRYPEADIRLGSLHNYVRGERELADRMQRINAVSDRLVGGLGDGVGEKAGALMAHAVTAAVTFAALEEQEADEVDLGRISELALAASRAAKTSRLTTDERRIVAQEAREALQREQSAKLDKIVKETGLTDDVAATFRRKVLGLKT